MMAQTGRFSVSPPGALFAVLGLSALLLPFVTLRANRIVAGDGLAPWAAAEPASATVALLAILTGLACGLSRMRPWLRMIGGLLCLGGILLLLSRAADVQLAQSGDLARLSPGAGFWCLFLIAILLLADATGAVAPGPRMRLALLTGAVCAMALLFWSGVLNDLSPLQEYHTRASSFWTAALRHLALALGSLGVAATIGFPLGVWCHRNARLRSATLPVLSFVQTIPSLAMFGIMIPILGWIGANVPGARDIGIAGIGFAPAFFALLLYSLLPVVSNTVAGFASVPLNVIEAARGMGMTMGQRLWVVELPLALPVIMAGLRIVLVQNIGLAVIAGLIGGGGFGTFVFQGLNQTATDLILLGALPTVAMAIVAAILMDILVDFAQPKQNRKTT